VTKDELRKRLDRIDSELAGEGTVVYGVSDEGWSLIVAFVAEWIDSIVDGDEYIGCHHLSRQWREEMAAR
jgi:hypothetical protein